MKIPVNNISFFGNEQKYINDCISNSWVGSDGDYVQLFEKKVASFVGRKYAVACSNGSSAIDMAIHASKLKAGDEVLIPNFTIISCVQYFILRGIKPIFLDCNSRTYNIDVDDIKRNITKKTKAILVVHIYGLTVDMDPLIEIANENNLEVIEDAAEVFGHKYKDKTCGSFGNQSTFSFFPNKHITTGEGGMVLTDDEDTFEKLKKYRNLYFSKERFIHEDFGHNYRMTNIQAALGLAQLECIDKNLEKKIHIGNTYNKLLDSSSSFLLPLKETSYCKNIYWVYPLVLNDLNLNKQDLISYLNAKGVGTRPFFYPLNLQPVVKKYGIKQDGLNISKDLYDKGFYIPSGLSLTYQEQEYVASTLLEYVS